MGKNMKEYLGLDSFNKREDGTEMSHKEQYQTIVNGIGLDRLINYVPATLEQVKHALATGEGHLNEIPIKLWDDRSPIVRSMMTRIGINTSSQAQHVCVLKQAAMMWVERDGETGA